MHGEEAAMIPVLLVAGLLLGRWWRFALAAAALAWPGVLLVTGVVGIEWALLGAAALAVANTLVGVAVHQGLALVVRGIRRRVWEPAR
jgi:hypothetical protein